MLEVLSHVYNVRGLECQAYALVRITISISLLCTGYWNTHIQVVVLEAASLVGSVTSARNSEVVHAGIYYPAGSNKAAFCVAGREMLYEYCAERGVPYNKCGKLIVATSPDEVKTLKSIKAKAEANGVRDLRQLTGEEARAMEPELKCDAALLSPSTGIVDSHSFMLVSTDQHARLDCAYRVIRFLSCLFFFLFFFSPSLPHFFDLNI